MMNEQTMPIAVPFPERGGLRLTLAMSACRLHVTPGETDFWVSGTYRDPTGQLPAVVDLNGPNARISQKYTASGVFSLVQGVPSFHLTLGKARPYLLTLEGGASENELDLGGLPLQRFIVKHGAGRLEVNFSTPNPEVMTLFELSGGAMTFNATNLANANFTEMRLEGGAATYSLDFGGTLRQDCRVRVSTGVSSVDLIVPDATAAKVSVETALAGLDVSNGWSKRDDAFWTTGAVNGGGSVLQVDANVAVGALRLVAT